uniref:Uncharacterized protein n=1 Tax=Riptortus pedestris TaxID=329032 RepID=R4WTS5_RIPPE|nr:unknown secreted protein [Riptortus pedestris]
MKFINEPTASFLMFILSLKMSTTNAVDSKFSNFYYMKNQVFALREELQVDGLEEDSSFTGGYGVKTWLVLPSPSFTYLIGVKRRGLNLITISKKDGSLFQAVEKPMDIEGNITSAIAFNILNKNNQRTEGFVIISTDSPKYEIIWFKIQNYKLIEIWSWIRYAGASSMHYFKVVEERMEESRLIVLDCSGMTAHVYRLAMDTPTPTIRELEVISFEKPVLTLSLSFLLQEPFLYVVHNNELGIYRYKRVCSEAWIGNFVKITSLRDIDITQVYPFHSEGHEYLAIAGKDSAIWRIEPPANIIPEIQFENILEWLIMRTGPHKERILLFGKSISGEVKVFLNAGLGWIPHPSPSCYKYTKDRRQKIETHNELRCLRYKSWAGVASLEIGELPTLIFSDRRYLGEMFHVMITMKRDMLPFDMFPLMSSDNTNNFARMRSNLDGLVDDIEKNRGSENACNVFDMLTSIEQVAAKAKKQYYQYCSKSANFTNRYKEMLNFPKYEDSINSNDVIGQDIDNNLLNEGERKPNEDVVPSSTAEKSSRLPNTFVNSHPISPDLVQEGPAGFQIPNDMIDLSMAGFPKRQKLIVT